MKTEVVSFKSIIPDSSILKPNYHLNYGKKRVEKALKSKYPFAPLSEVISNVYTGGIFKRVFVEDENYGLPYISAQHMMNSNPLEVAKTISMKHTPRQDDMTLRETQILVSCAGTVGKVRLIGRDLDGVIGSQDIIRINADNNKLPFGFLYAYLASPTAYNYMQSYVYGSVVPRIDPYTLSKLPIPLLSETKQHEVHNLIVESNNYRVAANSLLDEADRLFHILNEIVYSDYHLSPSENKKYLGFKFNIRDKGSVSLKAKNHSRRILEIKNIWQNKNGVLLKDYLTKPFRIGARGSFKRIDSDTIGYEMISQSDLHEINPKNFKRVIVSRRSNDDWANDYQVLFPAVGNGSSEGEILFRPTLAFKTFSDKLLSGDIGRFDCPSLEHAAYLLTALRSKGGFRMMRAYYYGTQLRRPLWELLKEINIPVKDESTFSLIAKKVIEAHKLRFEADTIESKAINLIEQEIESWQ